MERLNHKGIGGEQRTSNTFCPPDMFPNTHVHTSTIFHTFEQIDLNKLVTLKPKSATDGREYRSYALECSWDRKIQLNSDLILVSEYNNKVAETSRISGMA